MESMNDCWVKNSAFIGKHLNSSPFQQERPWDNTIGRAKCVAAQRPAAS